MILLELALSLSAPTQDKAQRSVHLSFSSNLQFINRILSDLQKLIRYSIGTAVAMFLKSSFATPVAVFPNNLAL